MAVTNKRLWKVEIRYLSETAFSFFNEYPYADTPEEAEREGLERARRTRFLCNPKHLSVHSVATEVQQK